MSVKFGICSWCIPGGDSVENFEKMSKIGLDGVQLCLKKDYKNSVLLDRKYRNELLKLDLAYLCLSFEVFCSIELFSVDDTTLDEIIDTAVKISEIYGCKIFQVPSFGVSMINSADKFNGTVDTYIKLCDKVIDKGLIVATENTLSADEQLDMIKKVNRPNFKIYFDTQNGHIVNGYDMEEQANKLAPLICEVHYKDGDTKMSNKYLGEGSSNFFKTANAIKVNGFSGFIHLENDYSEIAAEKNITPLQALEQDIKIMKSVYN